ncbi:hypothetical protein K502DRAFT_300622 [Neoconidiobolus thromboides FSU 785]|nr:hypothetical protein K502DRAFT_300622 [Neoconidiobolus thromboides FSU 785]
MVVLAASLCTASGKVLVSRQFVEVPKSRIEGLLSAFPKLTGSGSQHTIIETDNIRYVYQPMDNLFLILLTNRQSNILQDIETLRLMGRVFNKICHSTDEDKVLENSFDLLSGFDEIVSLGYRDSVTLAQISNTIEMESHEERIQEIIAKNKEKEAKEMMREKIKLMDEQRKRDALANREKPNTLSSSNQGGYKPVQTDITPSKMTNYEPVTKKKSSGSGMKLGSKSKSNKVISSIQPEIEMDDSYDQNEANYEDQEDIHFKFEEKVYAKLSRDGGIHSMDLRGELSVMVHNEAYSFIKASLGVPNQSDYQFMTNPKMDKNTFNNDYTLTLKDQNRGFPVNQSVGILKWKLENKNSNKLPFSVTCWVSPSNNNSCDITIEVRREDNNVEINDFIFSIPIPSGDEPELGEYHGDCTLSDDSCLVWQLPSLNEEQSECQLEFNAPSDDQGESFFPVSLEFISNQLISGLNITEVISNETQDSVAYSQETVVYAEDCSIV